VSDYAAPIVIIVLILAGGLYALWRISHKPGGNRAPDDQ
jgi:hypothetical protein